MRKSSFRAAALALVATLVGGVAAYAADPPTNTAQPQQQQPRRGSRLQQALGLTDDQMQKLRDIRARDFANQKQTWQAIRQAQGELRRLALNGADNTALQAKETEVQNLMAQSLQARVNGLREIGSILTPEQREAYAKMMESPRGHHRHMRAPAQPQG